jgi:hypothetical protein
VLLHIEKEIAETRKAIKKNIDDDPDMRQMCDLIVTIDGIGQKTLEGLLAELGDLRKCGDPRKLVAAAGLNTKLQDGKAQRQNGDFEDRIGSRSGGSAHAWLSCSEAQQGDHRHEGPLEGRRQGPQTDHLCSNAQAHFVYAVIKSGQPFDSILPLPDEGQDGIYKEPTTFQTSA